ncbi:MAG TPA: Ig-like domain-containing protein, partial [Polyangiaceae bacterium]|nr:Ig-like domain-containing protein [Polyangiaceae bacterium]
MVDGRAQRWGAERVGLGLACLVALLPVGCNRPKPGLGLQVVVIGNADPGERAKRIDVVFDRPMVASARLGEALAGGKEAPLRLEPQVPGTLRWREDRRLSFEPEAPLPRATAFTVTVPGGTRGLDDVGIREDYQYHFETERLTLATELVRDPDLPDPKQWAIPKQQLKLTFNQPVDPARVAATCRLRSTDGALNVELVVKDAAAPAREQFEVAPVQDLRAGTSFRFACEGLTPVEGPLPLPALEPAVPAEGQIPSGTHDFATYGAFKAEQLSPAGNDVSPDESITVHFSTPPGRPYYYGDTPIELSPMPERGVSYTSVSGSDMVLHVNGLEPHTEYTVKVAPGLEDAFGQVLKEPFAGHFKTGAAVPGYTLDTGSWAVEDTRGGYVAWARNIDKVEVLAAALSEDQLFR